MRVHLFPLFFGILFILIGLNILLKTFFNFNFPFFQLAFGLLIIVIGVKVMFPNALGNWTPTPSQVNWGDERTTMFGESNVGGSTVKGEYSVVFGSTNVDLTGIEVKETVRVKVDAVFGGAVIKIDPAKPVKITGNSAFGGVIMPNGNSTAFGTTTYATDSFKEGAPHIAVEVNAVFGGVEIKK